MMTRPNQLAVIGLLAAALVATVRIEERRVRAERSRTARTALHASNLVAERDSTRNVAMTNRRITRLLGDSLRVVERQVVQVAQRNDALDRALGTERRARYAMSVSMDSLERVAVATTLADSGQSVRRASFTLREAPYTVAAEVEVREPPDSARIAVRVALDSLRLEARLGCSAPDERGIRSATVVASSPPWATVRFDRVEQSPELCASPTLSHVRRAGGVFGKPRLVVGAGRVVSGNGLAGWGLFVGIGISLWG